jgi:hypothetical protein
MSVQTGAWEVERRKECTLMDEAHESLNEQPPDLKDKAETHATDNSADHEAAASALAEDPFHLDALLPESKPEAATEECAHRTAVLLCGVSNCFVNLGLPRTMYTLL